jgi:2,4-dienoyl-CoA reductase-like NADH-dependent reductase (Old Yellow Enzyme family)
VSGDASPLFRAFAIGRLTIPGRLIKTATSETRGTGDGFVTQELIAFYEPMARGGVPLIISGNLYTSIDGRSTPRQLGADDDRKIPALKQLVDAVHAHGSKMFAQISHAGRQLVPGFAGVSESVSASDVVDQSSGIRPRPLATAEIKRIIEQFGTAAGRCQQAGFDGVQIHAGHGYLISQFLTPYTNIRTDEYGGSFENRLRFLREIVREIRSRVGPGYPVIVKLNGSDYLPFRPGLKTPELVRVAQIMEQDGIDAVEVSVGHYESGFPIVRGTFWRCMRGMLKGSVLHYAPQRRVGFTVMWPLVAIVSSILWRPREGFNLEYARQFKQALSIPVISVGGFLTRQAMEGALAAGSCDAVSAGRAFIADPLLYQHVRDQTAGPRCVDCNACVGVIGTQPLDCYHPRVRAEKDAMLSRLVTQSADRAASATARSGS